MEIIELIYKDKKLLTMVEEAIDRAGTSVTDTSSLEDTIYARIARYIKPDKGRIRHYVTLRKFIYETISDYVARYRNENTIVFSGLAEKDDEDDDNEHLFEPADVLANVESDVVVKEMIALLAQDDHRTKLSIGHWVSGNNNSMDISRVLADSLGGSIESHRKYIQRFRRDCHDLLEAI